MDELEYLNLPEPPVGVTDIVNLVAIMQAGDLCVGGDSEDKLHDILAMSIEIVHMKMSLEVLDTTAKYNEVITGINRGLIKTVK